MIARLTPEQRNARWRRIILKILWVLRAVSVKLATVSALGTEAYRAIIEGTKAPTAGSNQNQVLRIYNGEGVGPLIESSTKGSIHPDMCQHSSLIRRGNRSSRWWTCRDCENRYQRIAIASDGSGSLTTEVLEATAASTSETELTRTLARELLERDRLYEESIAMADL
jgi:hypothetical protein